MDLSKFLNVVWRYLWLVVLIILVASLTTYYAISSKPALFEAKTTLLVGPSLDSPSPDLNSLRIGGQLIQTYAEMVSSRPFLESVNNKLDQKKDLDQLEGMIDVKQNVDTRVLTVFVRDRDPDQAVAIANAIATTLIEMSPNKDTTTDLLRTQMTNQAQQLEQLIDSSRTTIEGLETKLASLTNVTLSSPEAVQANLDQQNLVLEQLSDERSRLTETIRTLTSVYTVLRDTNTNQVEIIETAGAVTPVEQNIPLRVAASGLAGLILAICIIFSVGYFGDAIRSPEDFKKIGNVPVLSMIEKHGRLHGSGLERVITLAKPASRAANNYRMAVAKLLFAIGDSMSHSYLLSSIGSQSGQDTTEVTANLGVAFALAGKRVVLIDAQFHNPQLTKIFGAEGMAGLADFMAASSTKPKLIPAKGLSSLHLLPAGLSTKKNSDVVLNPTKIGKLIEELQLETDIILVAGSPISWFAESLTLATYVNDVLLVARPGEARIKAVSELVENLREMNVHVAGVIFDNNQSPIVTQSTSSVFEGAPVITKDSQV